MTTAKLPTKCSACSQQNIYPDGDNFVCADCGHEWLGVEAEPAADVGVESDEVVVRDANGAVLKQGDSVVLIKSLKVKGGATLKQGTKISGIKLIEGDHEIDCKVDNIGMLLKAQFVKKA